MHHSLHNNSYSCFRTTQVSTYLFAYLRKFNIQPLLVASVVLYNPRDPTTVEVVLLFPQVIQPSLLMRGFSMSDTVAEQPCLLGIQLVKICEWINPNYLELNAKNSEV